MLLKIIKLIISAISLVHKLWKDGTLFRVSNFLKKRSQANNHYTDILRIQQREARFLAEKLQVHFSMRSGDTFLTWQQWFDFTKGMMDNVSNTSWLDDGNISYMRGNLSVSKIKGDHYSHAALMDSIGYIMTHFSYDGQKVDNEYLELLLRNYMHILREANLNEYEIKTAKDNLRPLQMVMLGAA